MDISGISLFKLGIVILDLLVISLFFHAVHGAWHYRPKFTLFAKPSKKTLTLRDAVLQERWSAIERRFNAGTPEAIKLSLIEADKLADDILRRLGLGGEHMADRIQNLDQEEVRSVKKLWDAHRYRNKIVHDAGLTVSQDSAQLAMNGYKAFFEEVGIL